MQYLDGSLSGPFLWGTVSSLPMVDFHQLFLFFRPERLDFSTGVLATLRRYLPGACSRLSAIFS